MLTAADRINSYNTTNMPGTELAQLMDGADYGGAMDSVPFRETKDLKDYRL